MGLEDIMMNDEQAKEIWERLGMTTPQPLGVYSKDDPSDAWAQAIEEGIKLGLAAQEKK